ncbi:MAG: WG repeat-containing protein [Bacteroidia bacterium]|nr:WG repeat-containing protein [Bacteroidia bacterium]
MEAQVFSPVQIKGKWGYQDVGSKKIVISNLDQALPFNNGLALAQRKSKWGGFNVNFKAVIPFEYDELTHISPWFVKARKGENLFLLNSDGDLVSNKAFSDVAILHGTKDTFVVADPKGRYGLLTSNGNYLIQPGFSSPPQTTGISNVLVSHRKRQDSYYAGAVDLNGSVIVPFEYLFVESYGENSLRATKLNGNTSYYSTDGSLIYDDNSKSHLVIYPSYLLIIKEKKQILYNRLTGVSYTADRWQKLGNWYYSRNEGDKETVVFTDDGSSFTLNGQVSLSDQHDGLIKVTQHIDKQYRFGLIDRYGKEVLKANLIDIRAWNNHWAVIRGKGENRYSLFNLSNQKRALGPEYTNIELYPCGQVQVFKNKESSFLDTNLEPFDPEYNPNTFDLPAYYAWSEQQRADLERKYSYYTKGKSLTDYRSGADGCDSRYYDFSKIQFISLIKDRYGENPVENRLVFNVLINDKRASGVLDFNGKVIVPPIYQALASNHESGYISFYTQQDLDYRSKQLCGLMDTDGNIILDPVYDKITRTVEGVAIATVHGLSQMVNLESKKVLLSNYQGIRYDDDGHFMLNKHGWNGLADKNGNILIRPIYKELSYRPDNSGMYTAERAGAKFYVDLKGNEYPRSE